MGVHNGVLGVETIPAGIEEDFGVIVGLEGSAVYSAAKPDGSVSWETVGRFSTYFGIEEVIAYESAWDPGNVGEGGAHHSPQKRSVGGFAAILMK